MKETKMNDRIIQELINENLRIAINNESGWYWKSINDNGEIITLWVTDNNE